MGSAKRLTGGASSTFQESLKIIIVINKEDGRKFLEGMDMFMT